MSDAVVALQTHICIWQIACVMTCLVGCPARKHVNRSQVMPGTCEVAWLCKLTACVYVQADINSCTPDGCLAPSSNLEVPELPSASTAQPVQPTQQPPAAPKRQPSLKEWSSLQTDSPPVPVPVLSPSAAQALLSHLLQPEQLHQLLQPQAYQPHLPQSFAARTPQMVRSHMLQPDMPQSQLTELQLQISQSQMPLSWTPQCHMPRSGMPSSQPQLSQCQLSQSHMPHSQMLQSQMLQSHMPQMPLPEMPQFCMPQMPQSQLPQSRIPQKPQPQTPQSQLAHLQMQINQPLMSQCLPTTANKLVPNMLLEQRVPSQQSQEQTCCMSDLEQAQVVPVRVSDWQMHGLSDHNESAYCHASSALSQMQAIPEYPDANNSRQMHRPLVSKPVSSQHDQSKAASRAAHSSWQSASPYPQQQPPSSLQELLTSADQQLRMLRQLSIPIDSADELLSRLNNRDLGSSNTNVKVSASHAGTGPANSRPTGSDTGCKSAGSVGGVVGGPGGPSEAQMVSLLHSSIQGVAQVLRGLQAAEAAHQQQDTARRASHDKTPPAEADLPGGE